jgi:hypothetical protein
VGGSLDADVGDAVVEVGLVVAAGRDGALVGAMVVGAMVVGAMVVGAMVNVAVEACGDANEPCDGDDVAGATLPEQAATAIPAITTANAERFM